MTIRTDLKGEIVIKLLRSIITTLLTAAAFLSAGWLCHSSYMHHEALRQHLEVLTVRLRVAQDYRKEIERKKRVVARINGFLNQAESMGLKPHQWSTYDVELDQPVSFYEMAQIIDQCTNSETYIFKPRRLQVKTQWGMNRQTDLPEAELENTSLTDLQGDVQLTLQGMFYAGHP